MKDGLDLVRRLSVVRGRVVSYTLANKLATDVARKVIAECARLLFTIDDSRLTAHRLTRIIVGRNRENIDKEWGDFQRT